MDPFAALKTLDEALQGQDRQAVYDSTEALIGWCRGGGFLPFNEENHDWRGGLTRAQFVTYLWHLNTVSLMEGEVEV